MRVGDGAGPKSPAAIAVVEAIFAEALAKDDKHRLILASAKVPGMARKATGK